MLSTKCWPLYSGPSVLRIYSSVSLVLVVLDNNLLDRRQFIIESHDDLSTTFKVNFIEIQIFPIWQKWKYFKGICHENGLPFLAHTLQKITAFWAALY